MMLHTLTWRMATPDIRADLTVVGEPIPRLIVTLSAPRDDHALGYWTGRLDGVSAVTRDVRQQAAALTEALENAGAILARRPWGVSVQHRPGMTDDDIRGIVDRAMAAVPATTEPDF